MRIAKRVYSFCFFFSSRRRHTRFDCDWSSDVCSSDLGGPDARAADARGGGGRGAGSGRLARARRRDPMITIAFLIVMLIVTVVLTLMEIGRASCRERV